MRNASSVNRGCRVERGEKYKIDLVMLFVGVLEEVLDDKRQGARFNRLTKLLKEFALQAGLGGLSGFDAPTWQRPEIVAMGRLVGWCGACRPAPLGVSE